MVGATTNLKTVAIKRRVTRITPPLKTKREVPPKIATRRKHDGVGWTRIGVL